MIQLIDKIGEAGEKLKNEVEHLYLNVDKEFDLNSPMVTASQVRQWVAQWKVQEMALLDARQQILKLRASGFKLEDFQLDAILSESLIGALYRLGDLLDYLITIDGKDLVPFDKPDDFRK